MKYICILLLFSVSIAASDSITNKKVNKFYNLCINDKSNSHKGLLKKSLSFTLLTIETTMQLVAVHPNPQLADSAIAKLHIIVRLHDDVLLVYQRNGFPDVP